jgi:hypothetical protein
MTQVQDDPYNEPLDPKEKQYLQVQRITRGVWLLTGILEGAIGMRIFLKLIAANPNNPFAALVYNPTDPFLFLFRGLTNNPSFENVVFELHSLIAMIFYALVPWVIVKLIWLVGYRPENINP